MLRDLPQILALLCSDRRVELFRIRDTGFHKSEGYA
jgi:hypothetical protein